MNLNIYIFEKINKKSISELCYAANLVIFLIGTGYKCSFTITSHQNFVFLILVAILLNLNCI